MRVTCFGSGSSGNALLIQSETTSVLLDAGIPIRRLRAGLASLGVHDNGLSAVLISHEHSDHVCSLGQVLSRQDCPVLATAGTVGALRDLPMDRWVPIASEETIQIGDLAITPIAVPHDAAEPVGCIVDHGDTRAAIFTDLGEVPGSFGALVATADLVVFEANYDETMLARGSYPRFLKRRIRGPLGHLSNDECGSFLAQNLSSRTLDVWLAHLSENNNHPTIAAQTVTREFGRGTGIPRVRPLARYGNVVTWDSNRAVRPVRQAELPFDD